MYVLAVLSRISGQSPLILRLSLQNAILLFILTLYQNLPVLLAVVWVSYYHALQF